MSWKEPKVLVVSVVVAAAVVWMLSLSREPEVDRFPPPPTPSIAPDGTKTIKPGTTVFFLPGSIVEGDSIVCMGKGGAEVPPPGSPDTTVGAILIDAASNGDVTASCKPYPLAEL